MKNTFMHLLAIAVMACNGFAGSITEDIFDWILGSVPELVSGPRPDGSNGNYIHVPPGQGPFYYEVFEEGEGLIELYINDVTCCLDDPNPGYPNGGPMWGLQTSSYAAMCVGIIRNVAAAGCAGYWGWCTVNPYGFVPFNSAVRGADGSAFTPGWYKWTITGRWESITFTLHDVSYLPESGITRDDKVFGDCSVTYDKDSYGGACESVFGDGFTALYLRGDGAGGCEAFDVHVTGGSGVFAEVSDTPLPVNSGCQNAGWNELKQLFR